MAAFMYATNEGVGDRHRAAVRPIALRKRLTEPSLKWRLAALSSGYPRTLITTLQLHLPWTAKLCEAAVAKLCEIAHLDSKACGSFRFQSRKGPQVALFW